jgi:hypothetical protein
MAILSNVEKNNEPQFHHQDCFTCPFYRRRRHSTKSCQDQTVVGGWDTDSSSHFGETTINDDAYNNNVTGSNKEETSTSKRYRLVLSSPSNTVQVTNIPKYI